MIAGAGGASRVEHVVPRIARAPCARTMGHCHVATYGMVEEADDSPFSLFKFNGTGWHIPMNQLMAVAVEIEPFLSHRRCDQDPRPERAVERLADDLRVDSGVLLCARTAECH